MKLQILSLLLLLFLCSSETHAQFNSASEFASTEPTCGWDSLKLRISYPEILRRSRVWSFYLLDFTLDSLGNFQRPLHAKALHFDGNLNPRVDREFGVIDSIFIKDLEPIVGSVKWKPIVWQWKPIQAKVKIPLFFSFYGFSNTWEKIIVNVPLPLVQVSY